MTNPARCGIIITEREVEKKMMIFAWTMVAIGFVMSGVMIGIVVKDLLERYEMYRIRKEVEKKWLSR